MKNAIVVLLFCISNTVFSQSFLNLNFEYAIPGTQTPQKWYTGSNGYITVLDDLEKASLTKSLKIESNDPKPNEFGACTGSFPIDLGRGKNIEFNGKIKTKDITKGYAGLWWRVDGKSGTLGFDNMFNRGLIGTNDWKQVSIKMKVNENVTNINFGALFSGQGTAWFDDFNIIIDGQKFIDLNPRTSELTKDETAWLKQHIYPLKTFEPGTDSDEDLKILKTLIGDSKVVALGETSHGSSEIFKMKHRIIRYLTENDGFKIFSIEANMPESYKLNEYILKGNGNPAELIKGMYFWTWRTQEVLDMVEWMKEYNKSDNHISFTGFDMQFYQGAIQELSQLFNNQPAAQKEISELKTQLFTLVGKRNNSREAVLSLKEKIEFSNRLQSIRDFISQSFFPLSEKEWLRQNVRIIEQYLDNVYTTRDKYMAENLLWIKSQNPDSKIIMWAHNGHIKRSGASMGNYLSDSLKKDYFTIGFTFNNGNYTAQGDKGLSSYPAQESYIGTYEHFFNSINVPIFILDLREAKKQNSEYSKWLLGKALFRSVGALKVNNEFFETDLTKDFDLIIFINESSHSHLL
jgi:Erythromycin esterase homolog